MKNERGEQGVKAQAPFPVTSIQEKVKGVNTWDIEHRTKYNTPLHRLSSTVENLWDTRKSTIKHQEIDTDKMLIIPQKQIQTKLSYSNNFQNRLLHKCSIQTSIQEGIHKKFYLGKYEKFKQKGQK